MFLVLKFFQQYQQTFPTFPESASFLKIMTDGKGVELKTKVILFKTQT